MIKRYCHKNVTSYKTFYISIHQNEALCFLSRLCGLSCYILNLWTFLCFRSGNRWLPGSLGVQIVLEADTMTARTGNEEPVMSHGEGSRQGWLFGLQVWPGFKSIITISCHLKQPFCGHGSSSCGNSYPVCQMGR